MSRASLALIFTLCLPYVITTYHNNVSVLNSSTSSAAFDSVASLVSNSRGYTQTEPSTHTLAGKIYTSEIGIIRSPSSFFLYRHHSFGASQKKELLDCKDGDC